VSRRRRVPVTLLLAFAAILLFAFIKVASSTECPQRASCDTPFHHSVDVFLWLSLGIFLVLLAWETAVELLSRRNVRRGQQR
jgi:hypothetical protein